MLTLSIEADLNSAAQADCMSVRKKEDQIAKPLQPAYGKSSGKSYQKTENKGEKVIKKKKKKRLQRSVATILKQQ